MPRIYDAMISIKIETVAIFILVYPSGQRVGIMNLIKS
jgi:hypothetical protein